MNSIYLDNNATTSIDSHVAQKISELYAQCPANPASQHVPGRKGLRILESAKQRLLKSIDAPRDGMQTATVLLTSGGTEANNLAILGHVGVSPGKILFAATEHPSVSESAMRAEQCVEGCSACALPVMNNGTIDLDALRETLEQYAGEVSLVSIMLGNNETGVVQDLASICDICRKHNVPVHSDIVQAVGKMPFSMQEIGVSAVSLTGHKIHGPVGIGALICAADFQLSPLFFGGGQQLGVRPGTEPVVPAAALAECVERTLQARDDGTYEEVEALRDKFEAQLKSQLKCTVIAADTPRLPHTSNIAFHGKDRQALQMALDLAGVACSTGSACASGSSRPSPVLTAMGIDDSVAVGSLRFSFSKYTQAKDVEIATEIIARTIESVPDRNSNISYS